MDFSLILPAKVAKVNFQKSLKVALAISKSQSLLHCSRNVMIDNDQFSIAPLQQIFVLIYDAGSSDWPEGAAFT